MEKKKVEEFFVQVQDKLFRKLNINTEAHLFLMIIENAIYLNNNPENLKLIIEYGEKLDEVYQKSLIEKENQTRSCLRKKLIKKYSILKSFIKDRENIEKACSDMMPSLIDESCTIDFDMKILNEETDQPIKLTNGNKKFLLELFQNSPIMELFSDSEWKIAKNAPSKILVCKTKRKR